MRFDPPAILDPFIMTLSHLYQEPVCLEPLDADPEKNSHKSDHRIIISKPINIVGNKCASQTRTVKVKIRNIKDEGMVDRPHLGGGL